MTLHEVEVRFDVFYEHFITDVTELLNLHKDDPIADGAAKQMAKLAVDALVAAEERDMLSMQRANRLAMQGGEK